MSEVASRGKPELCGISVSASRAELSKAVSSIRPAVHKRAKGNGFGGNAREDIKGMSGNDVGGVRDHGNAVPGVGSLIGRGVNRGCSMRKSRGRVRM
jgi:hypothetical protein